MTNVPRMIIVNLIGGLGNQMFQYACGFALGKESGLPVRVSTDMFTVYNSGFKPELDRVFVEPPVVVDPGNLRDLLGYWRSKPIIRRLLGSDKLEQFRGPYFITERRSRFNGELVRKARHSLYLQGYWQNERYFKKHADAIRKVFVFRNPPTGHNAVLARQIQQELSISLHIRRGDYAHLPRARAYHGLCEPEYYLRAIEHMRKHVSRFRLYAFSDDPEWVESALKPHFPEMVIVSHNSGNQSYIDMQLMSLCNHHIIANSTFSWWGAWLNPDKNKIVITPRNWFASGPDSTDLIPESWIRL